MEGALANIEVDIEDAEGSIYLVRVESSFGSIKLLGDVTIAGRAMMVDRLHIQGLKPGVLGRSGLNAVARKIMDEADVDTIVIQGATRTTGKRPGQTPILVRFRR